MASGLNLSRVKIVDESGVVHDNARIRMPAAANSASLFGRDGRLVMNRTDVAAVERVSSARSLFVWHVRFADGAVWEVERRRGGCGCGK
jgi:hypothetical protein